MEQVVLKKRIKLEYRRAGGNGEALWRLLEEHPELKYGGYFEPRRAGEHFAVEFETAREGIPMVVLSQIVSGGTPSDTHHYILPKSDFEKLFSGLRMVDCCED